MRETVRSLRAYFIILGLLGCGFNTLALMSRSTVPSILVALVGLAFALGDLYVGARLERLLVDSPGKISSFLILGAVFLGLLVARDVLMAHSVLPVRRLVGFIGTVYLFRNVRRLAAESLVTR